jgi:hypothetical protein
VDFFAIAVTVKAASSRLSAALGTSRSPKSDVRLPLKRRRFGNGRYNSLRDSRQRRGTLKRTLRVGVGKCGRLARKFWRK